MRKSSYSYGDDLDSEAQSESKAEAKSIIKAFIRTENDAEQIRSRHQNKKPILFSESSTQKRPPATSSVQSDLESDMQLAFELINRRKEISKKLNSSSSLGYNNNNPFPPQPTRTDDSILMNMEMRHAKVLQMKEDRLKSKPQNNELKRPPSTQQGQSSNQKLNTSISSHQTKGSAKKESNKLELEDPKIAVPSAEILALKAKRQFLEQQSKKMEDDMKVLKENLRKEIVQDSGFLGQSIPQSTSSSFASSNITSAIESLQREAEESRLKYNQYRLSKLVKAFNQIQKRQRKVSQQTFFQLLRSIHLKYEKMINQVQVKMNNNRKRSAFIALSDYIISCRDKQDERFYLEQKQNEHEFLNRALDYYRFRALLKYLRFWKKFVKIQRDERLIDEEKSILKVKLKGFISNLKQTITSSEKTSQELKQLQKQRIIQEYLEANAKEEAEQQQKESQRVYINKIKEKPTQDKDSENDNEIEAEEHAQNYVRKPFNKQIEEEEEEEEEETMQQYQGNQEKKINLNSPEQLKGSYKTSFSPQVTDIQDISNNDQSRGESVHAKPNREDDQQPVEHTNSKNNREEKLKQIQKRTEDRKLNADSIRKKHEDLRKQKEEEKIRKEQEEIAKERHRRQEEYELFQSRKRDEKLKKENAEKAKQLQLEQLAAAKSHHLLSIQKYFGLIPLKKLLIEQEKKVVEANQMNYLRILKNGLSRLSEAAQISQHLTQLEDQSKLKRAQQHYKRVTLQKTLSLIIEGVASLSQESNQYRKHHEVFIKRNVFSQWNFQLANMRNENIEFEEQYKPIIIQFRKVVLLLRYFRNWKTTTQTAQNERIKDTHKQNIMNKVANWLTEFKPSTQEQHNNVDSIHNSGYNESYLDKDDDFNASQIKRDALMKYYSKKQELQNNQTRQQQYPNSYQVCYEEENKNYMIEEDQDDQPSSLFQHGQQEQPTAQNNGFDLSSNPLKQVLLNSEQLNNKFRQKPITDPPGSRRN